MRDLTRLQVNLNEKDATIVERYYKNGIPSLGWIFRFKQQNIPREEDVSPLTIKFSENGIKKELRVKQQTIIVSAEMARFKTTYITSNDFIYYEAMKFLSLIEKDVSIKFRLAEFIRKTISLQCLSSVEFDTKTTDNNTMAIITLLAVPEKKDKESLQLLDSLLLEVIENRKETISNIIQQFIEHEEKSNIAITAAQNKGIPNPSREGGQEYHRSLRDTQ